MQHRIGIFLADNQFGIITQNTMALMLLQEYRIRKYCSVHGVSSQAKPILMLSRPVSSTGIFRQHFGAQKNS